MEQSTRHALPLWSTLGRSYQGLLLIKRGDVNTGSALLRASLDEAELAGLAGRLITFLDLSNDARPRAGDVAHRLEAIEHAIDRTSTTEEHWAIAELLRVKGELLLLGRAPEATSAAEDHFRRALDRSARQDALSWQLRAATSLARLLRDQGRAEDAVAVRQPVYNRFTEGFDTADLIQAKRVLDELTHVGRA